MGAMMVGFGLVFFGSQAKAPSGVFLPDYPRKTATIKGETFTLLVPKTTEERHRGLAAAPVLPDNYGMLFSGAGSIGIWMKDMRYAIDIIWLDTNGNVLLSMYRVQPETFPTVFQNPIGTDARFVVELVGGEAQRLGLKTGDTIELR